MKNQKETVILDITTRMPNKAFITPNMTDEIELIHRVVTGLGWRKAKGGFFYKQFFVGVPDNE